MVNTTGFVRVDDAEDEQEACRLANALGSANLAAAAGERGIGLVAFSSDLVFDGVKGADYLESDAVGPLNCYGRCKAESETLVLEANPDALVVRSSAFFGPWDDYNFVTMTRRSLAGGQSLRAAMDQVVSPTYVPDLVQASLDLLLDGEHGVWHLANRGAVSWYDLACLVGERLNASRNLIEAAPTSSLNLRARRPAHSALTSERGQVMPALEDALERYFKEPGRL